MSHCPLPARRTAGLHCSSCARQGDCLIDRFEEETPLQAGYPRAWWAVLLACALAALLLTVAPPADARTDPARCAQPVAVEAIPFEPVLDTGTPHAVLTAMRPGGDPLAGAVVARRTVALSDDGCTLRVGWSDAVIYIAAELTRNPCAYAHVLTHEREHVRIYQAAVATLPQRIAALRAEGLGAVEAAEAALLEVRAAHAAHDSDDELATNRTACGRRIPRLLAGH